MFEERLARVQQAMAVRDVDVVMLSVGHDLPYLTGYHAMPLERLTMLVVPRDEPQPSSSRVSKSRVLRRTPQCSRRHPGTKPMTRSR